MLIALCPCCELGDGGQRADRGRSDTLGFQAFLSEDEEAPRKKRGSSNPPPVPAEAKSAFARKLLELNHECFGPTDALDLTDHVLEDSEELGQDQIDVLFRQ